MNQVKEVSRIGKVIEGLRMVFESLAVNDVVNETTLEREANIIRGQENTAKINELEKEIENVNIPLKDTVVEKATVSEKAAKKKADEVRKQKEEQKDNDLQK
ncbi:MAG: hypothetical protein HFJ57_05875 [Clostridia bacterium]|nr:hypothetical protein [Clostridia bacterium]